MPAKQKPAKKETDGKIRYGKFGFQGASGDVWFGAMRRVGGL